jgi:tetratricopeptide (TPR) repeat protein
MPNDQQWHAALTHLARLAQRQPEAQAWIEERLERNMPQILGAAIEVAEETGSPLPALLVRVLDRHPSAAAHEAVAQTVPMRSAALQDLAITSILTLLGQRDWPPGEPEEVALVRRHALRVALASRLADAERLVEARTVAEQAVSEARTVLRDSASARARSVDAYDVIAKCQMSSGDAAGAVETARRALTLRQEIDDPLRLRADGERNLGLALLNVGMADEACQVLTDAVARARDLLEHQRDPLRELEDQAAEDTGGRRQEKALPGVAVTMGWMPNGFDQTVVDRAFRTGSLVARLHRCLGALVAVLEDQEHLRTDLLAPALSELAACHALMRRDHTAPALGLRIVRLLITWPEIADLSTDDFDVMADEALAAEDLGLAIGVRQAEVQYFRRAAPADRWALVDALDQQARLLAEVRPSDAVAAMREAVDLASDEDPLRLGLLLLNLSRRLRANGQPREGLEMSSRAVGLISDVYLTGRDDLTPHVMTDMFETLVQQNLECATEIDFTPPVVAAVAKMINDSGHEKGADLRRIAHATLVLFNSASRQGDVTTAQQIANAVSRLATQRPDDESIQLVCGDLLSDGALDRVLATRDPAHHTCSDRSSRTPYYVLTATGFEFESEQLAQRVTAATPTLTEIAEFGDRHQAGFVSARHCCRKTALLARDTNGTWSAIVADVDATTADEMRLWHSATSSADCRPARDRPEANTDSGRQASDHLTQLLGLGPDEGGERMDAGRAISLVVERVRSRGLDYPAQGLEADRFQAGWCVYALAALDEADAAAGTGMPAKPWVFLVSEQSGTIQEVSTAESLEEACLRFTVAEVVFAVPLLPSPRGSAALHRAATAPGHQAWTHDAASQHGAMDAGRAISLVVERIRSRGLDYPAQDLEADRFQAGWCVYAPAVIDGADAAAGTGMPVRPWVFLVSEQSGTIQEVSTAESLEKACLRFHAVEVVSAVPLIPDLEPSDAPRYTLTAVDIGGEQLGQRIIFSPPTLAGAAGLGDHHQATYVIASNDEASDDETITLFGRDAAGAWSVIAPDVDDDTFWEMLLWFDLTHHYQPTAAIDPSGQASHPLARAWNRQRGQVRRMDGARAISVVAERISSRSLGYPTQGLTADRFETGWSVYTPADVDDGDPMTFPDMPVGQPVFLVSDFGRIKEIPASIPLRKARALFTAEEAFVHRATSGEEHMAELRDGFTGRESLEGRLEVASFVIDAPSEGAIAASASHLLGPIALQLARLGPPGWQRFTAVFSFTVSAEDAQLQFWSGQHCAVVLVPEQIAVLVRRQRHLAARMPAGPWWRLLLTVTHRAGTSATMTTDYDYGDEPLPGDQLLAPEDYRNDLETYPRPHVPAWLAAYIA